MEDSTQLLKNFDIKFSGVVNEFLKCAICKNVLVDACGTPCGCRFCWGCIDQHLTDGPRPCPGMKDECRETFLNTVNELVKDTVTDTQISFLLSECPNENCSHQCQLRKLTEHMRTCTKAAMECVFSYVGCGDGLVAYDKMKEHLEDRSVTHGRSLVAHIRNMENEMKVRMDRYEKALETVMTENAVLRRIGEGNAVDIERMKEEIRLVLSKEETLTRENVALKGELKVTQENVAVLRQRLDECDRRQVESVNKLQPISDENDAEIAKIKKEIGELSLKAENDKAKWKMSEGDMRLRTEEHREKINALQRMQEDVVGRLDKLTIAVSAVNGLNAFLWRIEGISEKIDSLYQNKFGRLRYHCDYSRPFFSDGADGYKLCLSYYIHSSDGLWLTFHLMRGNDNDRLQWPMNRTVLIEIIDEQCSVPVMSRRVCLATVADRKYSNYRQKAYDRPSCDRNDCGDGFYECVTYEQINATPGAIRNDSMTVRCRVLPQ